YYLIATTWAGLDPNDSTGNVTAAFERWMGKLDSTQRVKFVNDRETAYRNMAFFAQKRKDYEKASYYYGKVIEIRPEDEATIAVKKRIDDYMLKVKAKANKPKPAAIPAATPSAAGTTTGSAASGTSTSSPANTGTAVPGSTNSGGGKFNPHSIPPQLFPKRSATTIATNVIPNTYIVSVSSAWIKSILEEPSSAYLSSKLKCQDESFGLYRFVGNESVLLELKAKANLAGIPFTYQPEHYIQRRSLKPNDPLLTDQQYLDVIQMPLAWEQGLSGVNRYGDTLVVAVVDDGMDTSHPDLRENIWVNRKEIPWNGKDDDNNGYTDDYWGWNGGDSTPIIFNS
ncbi:MAG: hypothetical protein EBQ97_07935, partial [Bacteroidetes bacterium]|nr:hypothetical protein [Bacteroidota bacterium]